MTPMGGAADEASGKDDGEPDAEEPPDVEEEPADASSEGGAVPGYATPSSAGRVAEEAPEADSSSAAPGEAAEGVGAVGGHQTAYAGSGRACCVLQACDTTGGSMEDDSDVGTL